MGEVDIHLKVGSIRMGLNYQVYVATAMIATTFNSILFRNQGTSVCTIENLIILQPGQSFSIDGNVGEYFTNSFQVVFGSTGDNQLVVVSKVFV